LQGYTMEVHELIPSIGFTGNHRFGRGVRRSGEGANLTQGTQREKNRRWGEDLLTEGGKERDEVAGEGGRRWRPSVRSPAGENARHREHGRWQRETESLWLGSGWRPFFKTRDGHTGQSTVAVRCTPDSAQ
jgi:hypothetical protein